MALNKGENAGMVYLSVANGKIVRQHKEKTDDTIERVNKMGKTVHEEFFKELVGVISKIEVKADQGYGKQWQIVFVDGKDKYMVQLTYSGRYSSSFLKALPNVTPGAPVKFMPWQMDDKNKAGKTISGVTLYQNDGDGFVKVPSFYTKEEPNGLPEMKQVTIKGAKQWDDTDMMAFLESMAADWMKSMPAVSDEEAADASPAPF